MKRIQRYIAMGASLLIACLLTVAGVLAAGSITTTITVDIQYVGDVRANIYVATYSKAGPGGPYFKDIDTTVENFDTNSNVATIYNKNGNPEEKYQENETNLNNFLDVSQESGHENTFTFADDGYLKFFFLIENLNTTGSLTYTIGLSFGEEKNKDPMGAFTVTDETSEMANVFLLNKQENSSTKSLCTIVFKANQGTKEIETEQINIDITLTQADARPLDFEFVNGEVANSSIKMASTSANTDGAYYQNDRIINEEDEEEIVMLTEGTFVPGKSAEIFNGTEGTATITTLIRSDNFMFDENGNLKLYLLFENSDADNTLTYTITLTYGDGATSPVNFTFDAVASSSLSNVTMLQKIGADPTKSLCTLVFSQGSEIDANALYNEKINIKIELSRAEAEPVEFVFVGEDITNSVVRMATTSANTDGAYYQNDRIINEEDEEEIVMLTEGTFVPGKSAEIFNGTEQTATITTLIRSDNFRFDANGNLKLYLLFENSDAENTLTYTITLTYGDDATSPTNFTFNSTDSSALTEVIAVGSSGTPTKSLCTLVFSSATANALYNEKININISLVKTVVEPEP